VPSAWWETPAVTSCVLAAQPESAGTARHFTREVLLSWGFGQLADEAETIIGELVVNAVQHGTHDTGGHGWCASMAHARGTTGYPRTRTRAAWASRLTRAPNPSAGVPSAGIPGPPGSADGAVLRLCLLRRAGEVMLAVIDASDDAPAPRQPDWARESGRGLQIVDALSSVWGWSPIEGHGKAVWAVLPYE
jgi:cytochrome c5